MFIDEQRKKGRADELVEREPHGIVRVARLKRQEVNEDCARAAEKDVVRRRVLQREAFVERALREVERQRARRVKHLRRPLEWEATNGDMLMLDKDCLVILERSRCDPCAAEERQARVAPQESRADQTTVCEKFLRGARG